MEKEKYSFQTLEEKYIKSAADCIVNTYLPTNPLLKAIKRNKEKFHRQVLNKLSYQEHW